MKKRMQPAQATRFLEATRHTKNGWRVVIRPRITQDIRIGSKKKKKKKKKKEKNVKNVFTHLSDLVLIGNILFLALHRVVVTPFVHTQNPLRSHTKCQKTTMPLHTYSHLEHIFLEEFTCSGVLRRVPASDRQESSFRLFGHFSKQTFISNIVSFCDLSLYFKIQ